MSYEVVLHEDAEERLLKIDKPVRERIIKRIARMRSESPRRHMKHGLDFFVEEAGQYRIVYKFSENKKVIYFVGDHKEYEKWYSGK